MYRFRLPDVRPGSLLYAVAYEPSLPAAAALRCGNVAAGAVDFAGRMLLLSYARFWPGESSAFHVIPPNRRLVPYRVIEAVPNSTRLSSAGVAHNH